MEDKKGYTSVFDDERDILEIARDLDIECTKLKAEKEVLLVLLKYANKAMKIASTILKGSVKNLAPRLSLLEQVVDRYYVKLKELSSENLCDKNKK